MWPAFYGTLAALAVLSVWKDRDLRPIGIALVVSWAASNLAGYYFAPSERPAIYTVLEIVVALFAYFAWLGGKSRVLIILLAVSSVSVAANVAFSSIDEPIRDQARVWQIVTNACFGLECLLTALIGVVERANGGFGRRAADIRLDSASRVHSRTGGTDR